MTLQAARYRAVWAGIMVLVLSGLLGAPLSRQQNRARVDSVVVVNVVERYHRALSNGDTASALSLLADDAVMSVGRCAW